MLGKWNDRRLAPNHRCYDHLLSEVTPPHCFQKPYLAFCSVAQSTAKADLRQNAAARQQRRTYGLVHGEDAEAG